jgi:putative endonuclease
VRGLELHKSGYGVKYFKGKLPVKLVYAKECRHLENMLYAERSLKKLTRMQKEVLIKIYEKNNVIL